MKISWMQAYLHHMHPRNRARLGVRIVIIKTTLKTTCTQCYCPCIIQVSFWSYTISRLPLSAITLDTQIKWKTPIFFHFLSKRSIYSIIDNLPFARVPMQNSHIHAVICHWALSSYEMIIGWAFAEEVLIKAWFLKSCLFSFNIAISRTASEVTSCIWLIAISNNKTYSSICLKTYWAELDDINYIRSYQIFTKSTLIEPEFILK